METHNKLRGDLFRISDEAAIVVDSYLRFDLWMYITGLIQLQVDNRVGTNITSYIWAEKAKGYFL